MIEVSAALGPPVNIWNYVATKYWYSLLLYSKPRSNLWTEEAKVADCGYSAPTKITVWLVDLNFHLIMDMR